MTATGKHGPPRMEPPGDALDVAPDSRAARGGAEPLRLERALSAELARLEDEFGAALSEEVVVGEFESCVQSFASARIRLYVPVLSYRNARRKLRARALAGPAAKRRTEG